MSGTLSTMLFVYFKLNTKNEHHRKTRRNDVYGCKLVIGTCTPFRCKQVRRTPYAKRVYTCQAQMSNYYKKY